VVDTQDRLDADGYVVARQVLSADLLRDVRVPFFDALVAGGHAERVSGNQDRLRWTGDIASFDQRQFGRTILAEIESSLITSGLIGETLEALWGREIVLWERIRLLYNVPGSRWITHRDGWQMRGAAAPHEHISFWFPLTQVASGEDGGLAVARGSHRIPNAPAQVPAVVHPMHKDALFNTRGRPPVDQLAPLWDTPALEVGDGILFLPEVVHKAPLNNGPYLRLALAVDAQDARIGVPREAGLSLDPRRELLEVEWLTLAILAVQPSSPWNAQCAFFSRGVIGPLWSEPEDRVDRAFTTLGARGLIQRHPLPDDEQRPDSYRYFEATPAGRRAVIEWLSARGEQSSGESLTRVKVLFSEWLGLDPVALAGDAAAV
jgi:hypothetical protein